MNFPATNIRGVNVWVTRVDTNVVVNLCSTTPQGSRSGRTCAVETGRFDGGWTVEMQIPFFRRMRRPM